MSGITNFPTALDDDTSLINVVDAVTSLDDSHHNNLKEAVKALEAKIGIYNTVAPTSLDYRLGHPTSGHNHNGASGMGARVNAERLLVGASVVAALSGGVGFRPQVLASAPTNATTGTIFYDSTRNKMVGRDNATWRDFH